MELTVRRQLQPGIVALQGGLLWIESTQTLVAADAHFAYEDAIGGALPLWSTTESYEALAGAVARTSAHELILLGDVIHSDRLSEGAATTVRDAIAALRSRVEVTLVAGNHEGRSRGARILGETVEYAQRGGWLLVHGDKPSASAARQIAGHLHPSVPLARGESVPVFLTAATLIVVPALTPYSRGLDVLGEDCARALRAFGVKPADVDVVGATSESLYPLGRLGELRAALHSRGITPRIRWLQPERRR